MHWLLKTPQGSVVLICLLVLVAMLFYLFPTILAFAREVVHLRRIFLVNLLLAWTVVGWISVLIWSLLAPVKRPELDTWPDCVFC